MSKQTTLFKFGVVEKRVRQGVAVNVGPTMPQFTEVQGIYKCSECLQGFHSKTAVSMHKRWKHPKVFSEDGLPSPTVRDALSSSSRTRPIEKDVELVMHQLLESVEKSVRKSRSLKRKVPSTESNSKENENKRGPQRGADTRKSYSFSFRANF